MINLHASTEDKNIEEKMELCEKLEEIFMSLPKYDTKIILGDYNTKVRQEEEYRLIIRKHSVYNKLIEFAIEQNLRIMGTLYKDKNIHKTTWMSQDGNTVNQIDHVLIRGKRNKEYQSYLDTLETRQKENLEDSEIRQPNQTEILQVIKCEKWKKFRQKYNHGRDVKKWGRSATDTANQYNHWGRQFLGAGSIYQKVQGKVVKKKFILEAALEAKSLFLEKRPSTREIPSEVHEAVKCFYCRDDISRQAPGKKDVKSAKCKMSGVRDLFQKWYMSMMIGEAFEIFKSENKDV
ncbi:hypothetical protein ILUMI_06879 [Ignelater luminosus]|uniref:Endonuclease/exonuclease/phosphatase domain-containing protein n=1 Tax=Ignelater luminosus TaxID=2038154 RepID=A0A8K0D7K2_IGNLU|nr:hypothetical protein ILUMI_06879 [Ignelater luminosus]